MTSRLRWSDLRLPLMLLLITALAILPSAVRLVILAITPETEIGQLDLFDQRYFLRAPRFLTVFATIEQLVPLEGRGRPSADGLLRRV